MISVGIEYIPHPESDIRCKKIGKKQRKENSFFNVFFFDLVFVGARVPYLSFNACGQFGMHVLDKFGRALVELGVIF